MTHELDPPPPFPGFYKKSFLNESKNAPIVIQELVMTNKAGNITAQQFKDFDSSWTDDLLIELELAYWKII